MDIQKIQQYNTRSLIQDLRQIIYDRGLSLVM